MEIDPPFRENVATAEHWRRALDKVVPAVVVLHTTACRAFDTNSAGASYAIGFVVDKRRDIILTNRHVVETGPVVAEAMFVNREEIPVHPVYRDPELEHGEFVRVRTVHLNGKPRVLTLKQDLHYWTTWELRFDPDTAIWHRKTIKALDCSNI